VIHHRRYRIRTQFPTTDAEAQSRMRTLLSVIDASFRRGLEVVNLQTGAVIVADLPDDTDARSYSAELHDEWLAKRDRYLFVGKSFAGDGTGWGDGVFWGARPIVGT